MIINIFKENASLDLVALLQLQQLFCYLQHFFWILLACPPLGPCCGLSFKLSESLIRLIHESDQQGSDGFGVRQLLAVHLDGRDRHWTYYSQ